MWIRACPACQGRIRSVDWGPDRIVACPYCKNALAMEAERRIAPTGPERALWILCRLTEVAGVVLPLAVFFGHDRLEMSWLGAGLVAVILGVLLTAVGRTARVGGPGEIVGLHIAVLVLMYVLVGYGCFAFPPLDAMGGSAVVVFSVIGIMNVEFFDHDPRMKYKARMARYGACLILGGFAVAYGYHALLPWLPRGP